MPWREPRLRAFDGRFHIILAILSIAYWKLSQKKDRQMRELFDRVLELSETQTAAITKVEAALVALKEAIADLRRG